MCARSGSASAMRPSGKVVTASCLSVSPEYLKGEVFNVAV